MKFLKSLSAISLLLLSYGAVFAQTSTPAELNITLGEQRVKFAPTRGFQDMRLEVINSVGEVIFMHTTTEAEFNWNLRAGNGETLGAGLYSYAATIKFSDDLTRQHRGNVIIERDQQQIWLTANNGAEVSGTALNATRNGGRSLAGFTTGEDKQPKREVEGRDLVDEKGNKLVDAAQMLKRVNAALSGTQNRIAKFDAGGVNVIDSAIFETGGSVGIGTTTPQSSLDYRGTLAPFFTRDVGAVPGAQSAIQLGTTNTGSRNVGAGPSFLFFADNTAGNKSFLGRVSGVWENPAAGAEAGAIFFQVRANSDDTGALTERMRITGNGNVGIGTTTPSAQLSLGANNANSKLLLWDSGSPADGMGFGIAPSQFRLHLGEPGNRFSFLNSPAGSEIVTMLGNGNVGIGTTNPQYKLHVEGGSNISVYGKSSTHYGVYGESASTYGVYGYSSNYWGVRGESGPVQGLAGGVYGISAVGTGVRGESSSGYGVRGESGSGYGVHGESSSNRGVSGRSVTGSGVYGYSVQGFAGFFDGDVNVTGTVIADTVIETSDARLKQGVVKLGYGLAELRRLRPVTWRWKERPERGLQLGLIAQEVETVLPELVSTDKDIAQTKGINYAGLTPVLINAIQEQQKQIETLRQINARQQQQLGALQHRLFTVERGMARKARQRQAH